MFHILAVQSPTVTKICKETLFFVLTYYSKKFKNNCRDDLRERERERERESFRVVGRKRGREGKGRSGIGARRKGDH